MRREHLWLRSATSGAAGGMISYGHHGRPVLAFPSKQGNCWDYEQHGMIADIGWLIDDGRVRLYCVDSDEGESWSDGNEAEGRRARYEDWITHEVVERIFRDCGGRQDIITTGAGKGGSHAAYFALKHAALFPLAICQSATVDEPMDYVANLDERRLAWLRTRVRLVLICCGGQWKDMAGSLASTNRFGKLLADLGLPFEIDLWGYDALDDWQSWRAQIAHHLPRFA